MIKSISCLQKYAQVPSTEEALHTYSLSQQLDFRHGEKELGITIVKSGDKITTFDFPFYFLVFIKFLALNVLLQQLYVYICVVKNVLL